eukprot:CAMPEP_0118686790 /NCGR_PEP_ID=MMETSP0800-20121206/8014_1 /TAXON_ID=210618 ORGANISM="Striatella unipunctata, Strain CCMP2910" /NCGR_SAMPLE_ID=MMETSP0800 /ASSEMBLY_ACC=CAM_ASM_000638 /LENGTH=94 /DNA_ID=CAMNT_0006583885 /DNA_START=39 /DNA_END=323 /DNA_ORIENTATION=+
MNTARPTNTTCTFSRLNSNRSLPRTISVKMNEEAAMNDVREMTMRLRRIKRKLFLKNVGLENSMESASFDSEDDTTYGCKSGDMGMSSSSFESL